MPKYKVQFDVSRTGTLIFDADDEDHAVEIYENLINGQTYPDEIDGYEDVDDSNTSYFELTDSSGRFIAE
jgi:hypothetical protein